MTRLPPTGLPGGVHGRPVIEVDVSTQTLRLRDAAGAMRMEARVSTARNGTGCVRGSECTPLGWHRVRARIGGGCPPGIVFVARRPTGEVYSPELRAAFPDRDWILTRILWLGGLEPGRNRLGAVDTQRRYIYIHGCPDEEPLGVPGSRGCIRMRNSEIIDLFARVAVGTPVLIHGGDAATSASGGASLVRSAGEGAGGAQ